MNIPEQPEPAALPEPIIVVRHLWRSFGDFDAVRGISFDIQRGQVVGFIGANGAGKTTTMRIIATLELPTNGRVSVAGFDSVTQAMDVRRRVGWMPDSYGTYSNTTVREYLDFFARSYGYRGSERRQRINEVMEFTELTSLSDKDTASLSKGMGQRLCLGRTLLHDPDVLILDEPAAGLDPRARREFKHLVRILAGQGKTIFISSHILGELSEMCDQMLFIDQGSILHHGSSEELLYSGQSTVCYQLTLASGGERFRQWADICPDLSILEMLGDSARIRLENDDPAHTANVLALIVKEGFPVIEFHRIRNQLEDSFIQILDQQGQANGGQSND